MIKSSTGQKDKYNPYAILRSFILLLHRLSLRISRTHKSPPKPRDNKHNKNEKELGKDLGPWQEHVVGNNPTGRNHGRAAEGGDPATDAGSVLERGRERDEMGNGRMGMGELELPLPVLIPTRL